MKLRIVLHADMHTDMHTSKQASAKTKIYHSATMLQCTLASVHPCVRPSVHPSTKYTHAIAHLEAGIRPCIQPFNPSSLASPTPKYPKHTCTDCCDAIKLSPPVSALACVAVKTPPNSALGADPSTPLSISMLSYDMVSPAQGTATAATPTPRLERRSPGLGDMDVVPLSTLPVVARRAWFAADFAQLSSRAIFPGVGESRWPPTTSAESCIA